MSVHDTFRLACRATGVTEPHRSIFIDVGPVKIRRVTTDERFVILRRGKPCLTFLAMTTDDDFLNRGHFIEKRLKQWQQILVRKNNAVLGVVDDVFEIGWPKSYIQCVQDCAH